MINNYNLIRLQQNILNRFNKDLNACGNRVAYYFLNYAGKLHLQRDLTEKLTLTYLLHNIGAYKISNGNDHKNEAINGYMFFKYFSPYKSFAKSIYYSNSYYDKDISNTSYNHGVLINLFKTVDNMLLQGKTNYDIVQFLNTTTKFEPVSASIVSNLIKDGMLDSVRDNSYQTKLDNYFNEIYYDRFDNFNNYIKMILYTFVYYSEETLTHCQTTALIAKKLGQKMNLSARDINYLYIAGLVHDVGKICIPVNILENPNDFTKTEYDIIKKHVEYSKEIIQDVFNKEIVNMVYHHHERLDGSGYPNNLTAEQLSLKDRILSVADTISAVHEPRCYQQAFTAEQIAETLTRLANENKLDKFVVDAYLQHGNEIIKECNEVVKNARDSYRIFEREIKLLYNFDNLKNESIQMESNINASNDDYNLEEF